jgi:hypothetical protein
MPARSKTLNQEIPWDEIGEISTKYESVLLRIQRRNGRGQLQTLGAAITMETSKLPALEDWLQSFAGGGDYEIEIKDPNNSISILTPRFKAPIAGAARPPRFLGNAEDQYAVNPFEGQQQQQQQQPPQQRNFQAPQGAWANNLHPQQQQNYGGGRIGRPAPGATVASDTLAMQQHAEYKAETAKTIAKLEGTVDKLIADNKRTQDSLAREREAARDEKHKSELQRIEQMMQVMMDKRSEPVVAQKANGTIDIIAAMAPFVPVFAAMVTSRESSASKSMEVQSAGLNQLMTATLSQANKPDSTQELLKSLLPLAMPFISQLMEAKSPGAQAQLFNSMVENNLSQVAMMAQLIESFATQGGQEEPWWLPMIRETLGGVVGMTEAYMQGKGLPGQLPATPRQLPPGAPAPQMQTMETPPVSGFASYGTDGDDSQLAEIVDVPALPNPAAARARGERATQEVMTGIKPGNGIEDTLTMQEKVMLSVLPADFQTPEWRGIVVAVERQEDVEDVADLCASHIVHLINFNLLPRHLMDVVEDPARALDRVLGVLPVMKANPEYGVDLINGVIDILIEAEAVTPPPTIAEETPAEEEAPAPAAEEVQAAPATPAAAEQQQQAS